MQPNKTKLSLAVGAICLGMASGAQAASETFNITVETLPDVTLEPVNDLDFGANMFVTASQTCVMNAATPGTSDGAGIIVDMKYEAAAAVAMANYGALTGTGCVNGGAGKATPGLYRIIAQEGLAVSVKIDSATTADFSFNPNSGCIVTYDNDATADDDCVGFVPNTFSAAKTVPLTGGGTLDPSATAGEILFTVGGTITIGASDLTANTPYTTTFNVEVVY